MPGWFGVTRSTPALDVSLELLLVFLLGGIRLPLWIHFEHNNSCLNYLELLAYMAIRDVWNGVLLTVPDLVFCVFSDVFSIDWHSCYLELVQFFCFVSPGITSVVVLHGNLDNASSFAFCFEDRYLMAYWYAESWIAHLCTLDAAIGGISFWHQEIG